jgi:hypothetical protein
MVIAAGLVTGCSSGAGSPQPTSGGSSSSAPSSPPAGSAPHVDNPLDTTKFQAAPCTALSATDAQLLSVSAPGASDSNSLGPSCVWKNRDTGTSLFVSFVTANKDGLSSLYRQRDSLKLFQELPNLQGYPAVIWGQTDDRSNGGCDVAVGVTDSLNYNVEVQSSRGPLKADPCGAAQRAATIVLGHLKNGGS